MKVNLLKSKIVELGYSVNDVVSKMNDKGVKMSNSAWYRRLGNFCEFDRTELQALKEVLDLSDDEFAEIFFE